MNGCDMDIKIRREYYDRIRIDQPKRSLYICDETFINSGFDYDDIVAIRIENGEFYFLGWMEDAEHYKIQMMTDYTFGKLMRDSVSCGSLYSAITECDGYDQHVL